MDRRLLAVITLVPQSLTALLAILGATPLVLLSVVFWHWVWGIPGAFLGVPITAALLIAFRQVPALQLLAILLGRGVPARPLTRRGKCEISPKPRLRLLRRETPLVNTDAVPYH